MKPKNLFNYNKENEENDPLGIYASEKVLRQIFKLPEIGWTILTFSIERTVRIGNFNCHYPFAFPGIQVVATFSQEMVNLVRKNASFGTLKIGLEDTVHDISALCESLLNDPSTDNMELSLGMTDGIPELPPGFTSRGSSYCRRIGDNGVQSLSDALRDNRSLVALSLALNDIGPEGAKHLNHGLRSNQHLTHLNLGMNKIGDIGVELLLHEWRNESLYMLNLAENEISTTGAKSIGDFLGKKSSGIRELHLSFNDLEYAGGNAVFEGLAHGQNEIRILSLSSCHVGNSMKAAAEMLRNDMKLAQLDLSSNLMGDENCRLLCGGLRANRGLMYLDISVNNLTSVSGEYLGRMLKKNSTLKLLDVSGNQLQDEGIKTCFDLIDQTALEKLSLLDNETTEELLDSLMEAKSKFTNMRILSGFEDDCGDMHDFDSQNTAFTPFPEFTHLF